MEWVGCRKKKYEMGAGRAVGGLKTRCGAGALRLKRDQMDQVKQWRYTSWKSPKRKSQR